MKQTSIHKAALLGSASALGLNWIYDAKLLQTHKDQGHPMIFESIDHDLYKQAENGFDVYPNHTVGDLDFMGEVYYLTYMFFTYEEVQTLERYREVLYSYFREDYEYNGYIESYGRDFLTAYKAELDGTQEPLSHTTHIDKQLVGLLYILAVYEDDSLLDKEQTALHFARVLTAYDNLDGLTAAFYYLLVLLDQGVPFKEAALQCEQYLPTEYRDGVLAALTDIDINTFLSTYSGVACGLNQAVPLLFYILAHTNSWEEALMFNATLGGASSARGIFVSAIASRYLDIPEKYLDKLTYHIK